LPLAIINDNLTKIGKIPNFRKHPIQTLTISCDRYHFGDVNSVRANPAYDHADQINASQP